MTNKSVMNFIYFNEYPSYYFKKKTMDIAHAYGENQYVVLKRGLHVEMPMLAAIGEWLGER